MDGKICQKIKPLHSFLSTTKHLGKIRRLGYKQFLYFLLYVNSLKKFFVSKTKFNCLKKMSIILTASKNIKTLKIKFEVGFSYKDCISPVSTS